MAFVLVILAAPFIAWQGAQGGEDRATSTIAPHGIVVVGDSITARYDNTPGGPEQGWWSIVGQRLGADVTTYAQSGSGYLRPGKRCTGNRFIDRRQVFTGSVPSLVIVEGGRNDWAICRGGRFVPASDDAIKHAVDGYLDMLLTSLSGPTRIVVMGPPWGPLDKANGVRVTAIIKDSARRHGLEFIDMQGVLTADRVVDGIHPNRHGNEAIAARMLSQL